MDPMRFEFGGRIVIVGFGSIGQAMLPILFRHFDIDPSRIVILTAAPAGAAEAAEYGVRILVEKLTAENHRALVLPHLGRGDFLLNLSVEVSSLALVELCREVGALYLDTCIEPWPGAYTDVNQPHAARTNYAFRAKAMALKAPGAPTAVLAHGANPGMVSHLVKEALLKIADACAVETAVPETREGWAGLAQRLGIKVIHIAERDSQLPTRPKRPGEFVNTWSIDGFVAEGCQPAELGWGTHETVLPADGRRHEDAAAPGIYLMRPGAATRVRTWTPLAGPIHGFLITHNEAISIAEYYTVGPADAPEYRPTVHYAYHPVDAAIVSLHELAGRNWVQQTSQRLLMDEITEGTDELGVLLCGHERGAFWYGSHLSIEEARAAAPHNNATSLQVCAGILAGMVWAIRHPDRGIVEADEMDHRECMPIMRPYLGELVGAFTDWTPLAGRGSLFPATLDPSDPWQFVNIRVA